MIHTKFLCTYTHFFSDAQLEDGNPNLHPTRRALLSFVRPLHRNTLPSSQNRVIAEEDAFGDDEASDSEDSDDNEFWHCDRNTEHSSLCGSQAKTIDRFAILACLDVNSHKIRSSTFEGETTLHEGQGDTSDCSDDDFLAYSTASEHVDSPSSLVTSQDQGIGATSTHNLAIDLTCVATHPLTAELEAITLSENEDSGISSDDDSLFAQYAALLPSDKLPEKYKRCHLKLTKRVSPSSNAQSSVTRGCYRIVEFLHTNNFSEVMVAQAMVDDKQSSRSEKGRLCCIKIYHNGWPLPVPEDTRPELKAETQAYQRLSEAVRIKRPGFQFLMQLRALLQNESKSFFIMDVMNYHLRAVIEDQPWALNRVQETKRLIAQMALGLAALHSVGIIHRDFKPENVLIDYQGNVRIADFGSSKVSDECVPCIPGGLYAHAHAGTWPYIAPEVQENAKKTNQLPYGIEADYWSLGCIVFDLESVHGESIFHDRANFDLWCSLQDHASKENFLQFGALPPRALDLICGLVHPDVIKRFGFYQIIHHPYFGIAENSEFYYTQERALRRPCEDNEEIDSSSLYIAETDDKPHLIYI